jgi:hypothetical protein
MRVQSSPRRRRNTVCANQDYLDDAWSAVSQHRWFEQFGVIGPRPRDILEYIQKIAGLGEDPNGVNESVAWDAFFLYTPARTKFRRPCVTDSGALAPCPRGPREGDESVCKTVTYTPQSDSPAKFRGPAS